MKIQLAIIALSALAFTGCTSMSSIVRELAKDPAAVHVAIMTPYGSLVYDRANPGTNEISVGSNGISTKP